jgi:hypothetical protein
MTMLRMGLCIIDEKTKALPSYTFQLTLMPLTPQSSSSEQVHTLWITMLPMGLFIINEKAQALPSYTFQLTQRNCSIK